MSENETSPTANRLDLGLEALLTVAEQGRSPIKPEERAAEPVAAPPENGAARPQLDPFETLAAEKDWAKLSLLCESAMAAGATAERGEALLQEAEARLWWVRAQIESEAVPASIIAAPLDSASASVVKHRQGELSAQLEPGGAEKLYKVAAKALAQTARLLVGSDEHETAALFLERAWMLNGSYAAEFAEFLKADLVKLSAEDKPGSISPENLEKKRIEIERVRALLQKVEPKKEQKASRSKPAPERARQEHFDLAAAISRRRSRVPAVLRAAVVVLVLAALGYLGAILVERPHGALTARARVSNSVDAPAAHLPQPERMEKYGNLDALLYDIKDAPAAGARRAVTQIPQMGGAAPGARTQVNVITTPPVPRVKEVVNTSGPLEGRDFEKALRDAERAAEEHEHRTDMLFGDGSPSGTHPIMTVEALDREYRYGTHGKLFWITAKTSVFAEPQYGSDSLSALQAGDRILAEARLGNWLKIRAKKGDPGYILMKDTSPYPPEGSARDSAFKRDDLDRPELDRSRFLDPP